MYDSGYTYTETSKRVVVHHRRSLPRPDGNTFTGWRSRVDEVDLCPTDGKPRVHVVASEE